MKIAMVIPYFPMGGAENMCEELIYRLKEEGHEVTVINFYDIDTIIKKRIINSKISFICLKKRHGFDFSLIKILKNTFEKIKPDVIHSHLGAGVYCYLTKYNCKYIHTVHNVANKEQNFLFKIITKRFLKKIDLTLVALSSKIKKTICKTYKINEDDVPIVFNGIDLSRCIEKKEYSLTDTIKLLHVGRFVPQKNHFLLLDSFKILVEKYDNIELYLVGKGALFDDVSEYANALNISKKIHFLGELDSSFNIMSKSDIFVLTSNYEGLPITLIEALGTGLPVISTNVGGISDIITNKENGLLVNNDKFDIANNLDCLIKDSKLRAKLGMNALNSAKKYSSYNMMEEYAIIYNK